MMRQAMIGQTTIRQTWTSVLWKALIAGFAMAAAGFTGMPVWGLDGSQAVYVNGTVQAVAAGAEGTVDTTAATALDFHSTAGEFSIPYAQMNECEFHSEVKVHLGVAPAIAVAIVKKRAKNYFLTMTWQAEGGVPQVATLRFSKIEAQGLLPVLQARASNACHQRPGQYCGWVW
jgi:hypothetical protein